MRDEAPLFNGTSSFGVIIGFVSTQMLKRFGSRFGSRDHDTIQHIFQLGHIMAVGSRENQCQWDAASVDEEVTFAALFSPDP